ncbi:carcinoembryonic antigen-related cell adhesion molecule 1-like isoform X2 [Mesocricetus auratus]|uniref:Carcinoembryonic antigen-related cell adhesion molecule 1-like isoform X2 n=1 Tax=Mesocricetus auratus TaxID=10036 RepID=A0ABM2WHD9_MESAU|nr:carcinoembryonic antigen-related cell adhesion molecule 1-like isoform X2 [Mesocricetus auratus]
MELTSAPLHKGQVPWRGLLLAALLLTYCNSSATAQARLAAVPPNVVVGASVILEIHDLETKIMAYYWYRGPHLHDDKEIVRFIPSRLVNMRGPAHTGREKVYQDGFMLLENVNKNDAGTYTARLLTMNYDTLVLSLQFQVYAPLPKPNITSNNSNPMEGEDSVALMCEPETQNTVYLWRINGQSLSEGDRLKLSIDNRTLTLLTVVRTDTGPYECETRNLVSTSRNGPDVPIISPSDTHFQSRTNLSLSCHAASNPPAQYSWSVNGELQASSQELFIPNITTNNSRSSTCLVHNSATGLNRTTVKNIIVLEPVNVPSIEASKTVVKELESVSLTCSSNDPGISFRWLFKGEHLVLTDRMKLSDNNRILTIDPVKLEDSGEYKCEVSNPANFKDSDAIVLDIIPIYGKRNFWHSWGPIIGIVAQCLLGLAALIILVVFLLKTIRGRNLGKKENINQMKDGRKPAGK